MTSWRMTTVLAFLGLAALMVLLVACSASASPAPTPTTIPTTALTPTPAPTATATSTPAPTATPDPLVARGERVFQESAGGIGCQSCHGPNASGGEGLVGPDIRGKTVDDIVFQFETNPLMGFMTLTNSEIRAVAAYLETLATSDNVDGI